jgi:hypothetical protein
MIATSRQINALAELIEQAEGQVNNDIPTPEEMAYYMAEHGAYALPCELGARVWAIRQYNEKPQAKEGIVSEMYFIEGMRLTIVVKNVARGEWGKKVFATREECERAINER